MDERMQEIISRLDRLKELVLGFGMDPHPLVSQRLDEILGELDGVEMKLERLRRDARMKFG
jgi:hypothetical protein